MPFDSPIITPVAGDVGRPVLDPHGNEHISNSSDVANSGSGWHNFLNDAFTNLTGWEHDSTGFHPSGYHKDENGEFVPDVQKEGISEGSSTSAKEEGSVNLSGIIGNSAISSSQGLSMLRDLYNATGDEGYLELIATSLLAQENTASAREWEKMMSDTSFSRLIDDIQSKGYNPWLALQNGYGTTANSGVGVASTGSGSVSNARRTAMTSEENTLTNLKAQLAKGGITAITAFLLIMAKALLI